jgi:hypothetical protein
MTIEIIHDDFTLRHLLRFYDGNVSKDKVFNHRTVAGARIEVTKILQRRYRIRVTPEARALLVEDARRWALEGSQADKVTGTEVYQYLTATANVAVV